MLGLHRNTFEFTKDSHLTLRGDCIIGINADHVPKAMSGKITIFLECRGITDQVEAIANEDFTSDHEVVIRITEYVDQRTFAIRATKAAKDIKRELIDALKNPNARLHIKIQS
ncbi:DUF371 domain-containing protein [Candidatus Woesearchaeota archaeon CG08_land_8_20_14_0_20_43_7]|nr:MAG: DUF371 domain-containing protein [Candidatus Woesearchaeota archaeon CG08_land_8_20_14_0_20_43_7]